MEKVEKKQYLKLVSLIVLLVTMTLGGTYAFLYLNNSSQNAIKGEAGCFNVKYDGNEIKSSNLSITDNYLEGAKTKITLSKDPSCTIYTKSSINIYTNGPNTPDCTETTQAPDPTNLPLSSGALKYKIFKDSTEIGNGAITTKCGAQEIANVDLTTTDTTYTVYLWVDSTITNQAGNERDLYDNKKYSGYIYAESNQQSTIK